MTGLKDCESPFEVLPHHMFWVVLTTAVCVCVCVHIHVCVFVPGDAA